MKLKSISSSLIMVGAIAIGSSAQAALLDTQGAFVNGTNQWSDDFGELWIDRDLSTNVSVGDWFLGGMGITSFPSSGATQTSYHELTGLFAVEVTSRGIPAGIDDDGNPTPASVSAPCGNGLSGNCSNFSFGAINTGFNSAITAFNAAYSLTLPIFNNLTGGALAAGTTGILFQGNTSSNDFKRDGISWTSDNFFNTIVNGDAKMIFGFADQSDYWTGTGLPTKPFTTLPTAQSGVGVGGLAFLQTILEENFDSFDFGQTVAMSGSLSAPSNLTPFGLITGDVSLTLDATSVPEPASLALLSIGLLGFAIRRQKNT